MHYKQTHVILIYKYLLKHKHFQNFWFYIPLFLYSFCKFTCILNAIVSFQIHTFISIKRLFLYINMKNQGMGLHRRHFNIYKRMQKCSRPGALLPKIWLNDQTIFCNTFLVEPRSFQHPLSYKCIILYTISEDFHCRNPNNKND